MEWSLYNEKASSVPTEVYLLPMVSQKFTVNRPCNNTYTVMVSSCNNTYTWYHPLNLSFFLPKEE